MTTKVVCKRASDMEFGQVGYIHCMSGASGLCCNPPGTRIEIKNKTRYDNVGLYYHVKLNNNKHNLYSYTEMVTMLVCENLKDVNNKEYVIGW